MGDGLRGLGMSEADDESGGGGQWEEGGYEFSVNLKLANNINFMDK